MLFTPCHKLSHLLGPPSPLERDVLYGRPHMCLYKTHYMLYALHKYSCNRSNLPFNLMFFERQLLVD